LVGEIIMIGWETLILLYYLNERCGRSVLSLLTFDRTAF
jgi:hypothetical protein